MRFLSVYVEIRSVDEPLATARLLAGQLREAEPHPLVALHVVPLRSCKRAAELGTLKDVTLVDGPLVLI